MERECHESDPQRGVGNFDALAQRGRRNFHRFNRFVALGGGAKTNSATFPARRPLMIVSLEGPFGGEVKPEPACPAWDGASTSDAPPRDDRVPVITSVRRRVQPGRVLLARAAQRLSVRRASGNERLRFSFARVWTPLLLLSIVLGGLCGWVLASHPTVSAWSSALQALGSRVPPAFDEAPR
jgi:hypothetical protein